jgi:hypothetical protein
MATNVNISDPITKKFTTGRLFFLPSGAVDGYIDFGNAVDYKHGPKVDYLEHDHSALGRKKLDLSLIKSHAEKKIFTLDEDTYDALVKLWLATQGSNFVQSSSGSQNVNVTAVAGRVFDLGFQGVTVNTALSSTSVALVAGTDYTLDPGSGMFTVLVGSAQLANTPWALNLAVLQITDATFVGLNNLLSRGTFKYIEFDQFDPVPRNVETFSGQCEVTAWGDNKGDKFYEYTLEVLITPQ